MTVSRIVIRPRIQRPLLVVIFTVWGLIGITFFTNGDVVAQRDWFGISLGVLCVLMGVTGVWRASRLGVIVDDAGVRVRNFDSRDDVLPWRDVRSVECAQIDERSGRAIYGPVIELGDGFGALALRTLGSYSRRDAERKVERLRGFLAGGWHAPQGD